MDRLRQIRVLVVDDEKLSRTSLEHLVDWKANGFVFVGSAANGSEGLDYVDREKPDIVLTDIRMPEIDGLEMIERIRKSHPDIVFAVLSGYGEFELTSRAMRAGIRHYLLKPCNENDVLDVLRELRDEVERGTEARSYLEGLETEVRRLEATLGKVASSAEEDQSTPSNDIVSSLREWALRHYSDRELTLKWMGRHLLYMNPEYLGRVFLRETGERFGDFLLRIRMERAKHLLVARQEIRIFEIAVLVGYPEDGQYFCRAFKKYVGLTASEYRNTRILAPLSRQFGNTGAGSPSREY